MMNYLYSFLYCIITAASVVFAHSVTQTISPITAAFLTFVVCLLWFNIVNYKLAKKTYRTCQNNLSLIFLINLATAINWITTFLAIKYISPVLFVAVFMALMPIMIYLLQLILLKKPLNRIDLCSSLIIIFLVSLLVYSQTPAVFDQKLYWMSLALTALSSLSAAAYFIWSKRAQDKLSLNPTQILSIRFYLLVTVSAVCILLQSHFSMTGGFVHFYGKIILLSLLTSIIPLFFLQKSIQKIGAVKTSFFMPMTPIFTFLLVMLTHGKINFSTILVLLLLTLLLLSHSFYSNRKPKLKIQNA